MYQPAGESRATFENTPGGTWTVGQLSGLAAIYFLFVGLTGFLAYVVQQALTRGMIFEDMVWSIAAMKVATGIWLLGTAMIENQRPENDRFFHHAIVLALAIVVVFHSHTVILFFCGLLIFELAFNSLSTRIKAAVVAAGPQFSGPWLTGVILLGAATGPVLNGCAISLGLEGAFILLSILSAFGPALWQRFGGPGVKPL